MRTAPTGATCKAKCLSLIRRLTSSFYGHQNLATFHGLATPRRLGAGICRPEEIPSDDAFPGTKHACFERRSGDGRDRLSRHHVFASEEKRSLFVASLRYYDVFIKAQGRWLFRERKRIVDWAETRRIEVSQKDSHVECKRMLPAAPEGSRNRTVRDRAEV